MQQRSEVTNYSDLKQEVEALRKRIEDLESGHARPKTGGRATCWRRPSRRPALALSLVIVAVLLALGVLGAQSKQDALFIDQNGNVGIGTNNPYVPLTFPNGEGDKISLHGQSGKYFGFGIGPGQLQIHTDGASSHIVFGWGKSGDLHETMRLQGDGNVGIGRTDPKASLDVAGTLKVSGESGSYGAVGINTSPIPGQNLVITPAQGNVPFNVTDPTGSINWLSVLSDGRVIMNGGNVGVGTANPDPTAKLDVAGDVRIQGKVSSRGRYQRDDEAERTYEIPPPYHLSLTAARYGGRTKTIPKDVLVALCGGSSSCELRLAMTRWDNDTQTEGASRSVVFYYSANNGRWRASNDASGVAGDKITQHVLDLWGTCLFTDGTYFNYKDQGDKGTGMQLLVWNNRSNANRTCELTLTSGGAPLD